MPAVMTILNPAPDEESDSNISLDLQVSDPEDIEDEPDKDKFLENVMEVEDEDAILNKFESNNEEKVKENIDTIKTAEKKLDIINEACTENDVSLETEPSLEESSEIKNIEDTNKSDEKEEVEDVLSEKEEAEDVLPEKEEVEDVLPEKEELEDKPSESSKLEESCDNNIESNVNDNSSIDNKTNHDSENNIGNEDLGNNLEDADLMDIDEECSKNESIKEDHTPPELETNTLIESSLTNSNDKSKENSLDNPTEEISKPSDNEIKTSGDLVTEKIDNKLQDPTLKTTNVEDESKSSRDSNLSEQEPLKKSTGDSNQASKVVIITKSSKKSRSCNKYDDSKSDTYEISEKEVRRSSRKQESVPILTIRRSTRRRKLSNASEESNLSETVSETSEKSDDFLKCSEEETKKSLSEEVKKHRTSRRKEEVQLKNDEMVKGNNEILINETDKPVETNNKENKMEIDESIEEIDKNKTIINETDNTTPKNSKDFMDVEKDPLSDKDDDSKKGALDTATDSGDTTEIESKDGSEDGKDEKDEGIEHNKHEKSNDITKEEEKRNDIPGSKEDSDEQDGEDLLLVMDEKSPEADLPEEEEDNSGGEDKSEKENDESLSRDEDIQDSTVDDAMDIDEELIGADNILDSTTDTLNETVIEKNKTDAETEITEESEIVDIGDEDDEESSSMNDKNESSLLATILKKGQDLDTKESTAKAAKRTFSSPLDDEESTKKIKLSLPIQTQPIKKLASFKQFMLDSSLENLTRNQLEDFCIQKMGECIAHKSEIGELKMKVQAQEQLLDSLRKETIALSKQTRDLSVVHQKVMADLCRISENSDRPLIVPKITRSVGLQAIVRDDSKKKTVKMVEKVTKPSPTIIRSPNKQNGRQFVTNSTLQKATLPARILPQQAAKNKVPTVVQKKTDGDSKGVIDLTDEDDKKVVNKPVKLNMINTQPGHKLVMMPNGQAVMVKLASPGVVVTQPVLRTVSTITNGVARTVSPQSVRQPAKTVLASTTPRPRGPNSVGNRMPARPIIPVRNSKHPAPLPHPPPIKPDVKSNKPVPPKPQLMLNKTPCGTGIVLSWKMPYKLDMFEDIASYQLYAYQETKAEPRTENWGKIGDVKALELPMAVTLTQFAVGNRYYFAVRAVDILYRHGAFSECQTILL